MPSELTPRPRRRWRVIVALRLTSLAMILFGPIVFGAWSVHVAGRARSQAADRALPYADRRNPAVDAVLPEGRGGTHVYADLGGDAGRAFTATATIGLSNTAGEGPWPESVELHERAHLAHAFLPTEVERLLARLGAPAPDEYAATNPGEHFGEMAARAWEIASPPDGFCLGATPAERLEEAETRVPGTAGFVVRYLRYLTPAPESYSSAEAAAKAADELRALADRLSAPQRAEWEALWQAIDARRRPGGDFEPWGYRTVREFIEAQRTRALASGRWLDTIAAAALVPSLTVLTLTGR